jgi:putative tryptophan/tyrosine transport system substrate-binding protein
MRRREFITVLSGAASMVWPIIARAQQPAKMKRIAMVSSATKIGDMTITGPRWFRAFFEELGALGYAEGRNLLVARYSGEGRLDHYAELARDIVSTRPDLIISMSGPLATAFKTATTTIPIVTIAADPVAAGLVPSLAHSGGNITGVSVDAGIQIWGKRLGLLIEAIPKLSNTRFLTSQPNWERLEGPAVREAASQARISLAAASLGSTFDEAAYQRVFTSMKQDQVDALVVSSEGAHIANRALLVELAAKTRIPAIYPLREFTEVGGLLAYSVDLADIIRRIADLVDKILKGANPGDIPFFQPTKFELIINLKTAKALGLEMPPILLGRADEVIE